MTSPTDETLMAFADGALPPDQRQAIEAHLATSPDDRARVALFKQSILLARRAVDDVQTQPRAALVDMLRSNRPMLDAGSGPTPGDADRVIPFLKARPRRISLPPYMLPLAACLALLIGFGSGYYLRNFREPALLFAVGAVPSDSRLAVILELEMSGAPSMRQRDLQIAATFMDRSKRPCREIEQLPGVASNAPIAAAIACRDGRGWVIEGAARMATSVGAGDVRPSGTTDRDALGGVLDRLGVGPSLSRDDEKRLIEQKWR